MKRLHLSRGCSGGRRFGGEGVWCSFSQLRSHPDAVGRPASVAEGGLLYYAESQSKGWRLFWGRHACYSASNQYRAHFKEGM